VTDPAAEIEAGVLSSILRNAERGDTQFARIAIRIFVAKVSAGMEIPDDLLKYVAGRLGQVLETDSKKVARALGLVGKRGPNSGRLFRPIGNDYWYALAMRTLIISHKYEAAKAQIREIADCSDSSVDRACTRFSYMGLEPASDNGRLPGYLVEILSKSKSSSRPPKK